MIRFSAFLLLAVSLVSGPATAALRPAAGRLLVATAEVDGEIFSQTVILLLHYDESGAMGIVVNRPTDVRPGEVMVDPEDLSGYRGTLYWGGPVEMVALWALVRSDSAPDEATTIVEHVHLVPFDDALIHTHADATSLRLYIGYAGWAPGQLEDEIAANSWHVIQASEELIFAEDAKALWSRLAPAAEYRAAVRPTGGAAERLAANDAPSLLPHDPRATTETRSANCTDTPRRRHCATIAPFDRRIPRVGP